MLVASEKLMHYHDRRNGNRAGISDTPRIFACAHERDAVDLPENTSSKDVLHANSRESVCQKSADISRGIAVIITGETRDHNHADSSSKGGGEHGVKGQKEGNEDGNGVHDERLGQSM